VSYAKRNIRAKKGFATVNVHAKNVTHAPRIAGASQAADAGVQGENIDKHGLWNERQKTYTAAVVPGDVVTVLAGFPCQQVSNFTLKLISRISYYTPKSLDILRQRLPRTGFYSRS